MDIAANRYAQDQLSITKEIAAARDAIPMSAPPPQGRSLEECATAISTPADCVPGIPWRYFKEAVSEQMAGIPSATYIDAGSWFCNSDGRCPSFVGHTPVRRRAAYAQLLETILDQPQRRCANLP